MAFLLFVVFRLCLPAVAADRPPIELPVEMRHANYGRDGSCAYAAAEDLLSLQGRDDLARYVREHYAGGATLWPSRRLPSLLDVAESLGLAYDFVAGCDGAPVDEHWLRCASDRGLGAVVRWTKNRPGDHATTFLGFDGDGSAWIIDNNSPKKYRRLSREAFLTTWTSSGGDAFTFILPPKE